MEREMKARQRHYWDRGSNWEYCRSRHICCQKCCRRCQWQCCKWLRWCQRREDRGGGGADTNIATGGDDDSTGAGRINLELLKGTSGADTNVSLNQHAPGGSDGGPIGAIANNHIAEDGKFAAGEKSISTNANTGSATGDNADTFAGVGTNSGDTFEADGKALGAVAVANFDAAGGRTNVASDIEGNTGGVGARALGGGDVEVIEGLEMPIPTKPEEVTTTVLVPMLLIWSLWRGLVVPIPILPLADT